MGKAMVGWLAWVLFAGVSHADDRLDKVVIDGNAPDLLSEDPVLPQSRGKLSGSTGSGGMERSLSHDLALGFTDTGMPGNRSQILGFGMAPGETDVNTLGIPLNQPQGGGFDFSVFPSFMWSEYRFQLGPGLGAFDPSSSAGSLTLYPWTAAALGSAKEHFHEQATFSQSSLELTQLSGAVSRKDERGGEAVLYGQSWGVVKGGSGSLSADRKVGVNRFGFHLLGTNVDAETRIFSTAPVSHKKVSRMIPVAQADWKLGEDLRLKNSAFYDYFVTRSNGGLTGTSRAEVRQFGTENALASGGTRLGVTARRATYHSLTQKESKQDILNSQASHAFGFIQPNGELFIEPLVRGTVVSGYGLMPETSLGARREWSGGEALFIRASYTRKYPTLADRYYVITPRFGRGFRGNADLSPERNWTGIFGGEASLWDAALETSLQGFVQLRQNSQILTAYDAQYDTYTNQDRADVQALLWNAKVRLAPTLDFTNAYTLTHSRIRSTGLEFPYVPKHLDVMALRFHDRAEVRRDGATDPDAHVWRAELNLRMATKGESSNQSGKVPGYGLLDASASAQVSRHDTQSLRVGFAIENITDRDNLQLVRDFPLPGRVFSVNLTGTL